MFTVLMFKILYYGNRYACRGLISEEKTIDHQIERWWYAPSMRIFTALEHFLLKKTEYAAPSIIEKIQVSKMRHILSSAAHTPYWEERIADRLSSRHGFSRMDELKDFPILTRKEIQEFFPSKKLTNNTLPKRRRVFAHTSGSTGEPLSFFLDTLLVSGRRACYLRLLRWLELPTRPVVIKALRAYPLGFINFPEVKLFRLQSDQNIDISLANVYFLLRFLHKKHPTLSFVIDMFPSNMVRFVQMFEKAKLDGSYVRGFIPGAETLLPGERNYIEQKLPCKILTKYVSTEFEVIGQECGKSPEHAYHINAEYFFVEIVDENGIRLPRGKTGRLLITSLDNEAMPFIRYDTGDLGRFIESPCPCGRTLPLLTVEGRGAHLMRLPSGRAYTQFSILSAFYYPDVVGAIRQYQVVRTQPTEVLINMVLNNPSKTEIIETLRKRLTATFEDELTIRIAIVDHIPTTPRGKRIGYLSEVQ